MAAINGTTVILNVDSNPIALQRETVLTINQDLPDSSNKDSSGWAENIQGQRSWEISLSGLADFGNNENLETLANLITNRNTASIEWAPSTSGDVKFTGTVNLSNLEIGAPNEGVATLDGTLVGTGALTKSAVS